MRQNRLSCVYRTLTGDLHYPNSKFATEPLRGCPQRLGKLAAKISYSDLEEMMAERGVEVVLLQKRCVLT